MFLNREIAQPVVNKIMKVFKFNINIMNENGVIIASGDPMRINQLHRGAQEVIKNNYIKAIHQNEFSKDKNVLPGVNLPIVFQDNTIGVVGITGNPQEVTKFGEIIKITVESLIAQQQIERLTQHKQLLIDNWFKNFLNKKTTVSEAITQAEKLNINTSTRTVGIFIEFNEPNNYSLNFYHHMDNFETNINNFFFNYEINFYSKVEIGTYFLSIKLPKYISFKTFLKDIKKTQKQLDKNFGQNYVGISTIVEEFSNLNTAFYETKTICEILQHLENHTSLATINDLGMKPIIYAALKNEDYLFLPPLFQMLDQLDDELLHTLQIYYECNMQNKVAIERLHIHRNTLYYRIEKISEFLNADIKSLNIATMIMIYIHYKKVAYSRHV